MMARIRLNPNAASGADARLVSADAHLCPIGMSEDKKDIEDMRGSFTMTVGKIPQIHCRRSIQAKVDIEETRS